MLCYSVSFSNREAFELQDFYSVSHLLCNKLNKFDPKQSTACIASVMYIKRRLKILDTSNLE